MELIFKQTRGDKWIWIVIFILSFVSILAVYSSTGTLVYQKGVSMTKYLFKHGSFVLGGLGIVYITHLVPYKYYSLIGKLLIFPAAGLLLLTYFIGVEINDAQRWIYIPGGFTFQPSDLARLALFMFLARELSRRQENIKSFWKGFVGTFWAVVLVFSLIAPANLSTALMIFGTSILLMLIGRVSFKQIAAVCLAGAIITSGVIFFGPRKGVYVNRVCAYAPALCDYMAVEYKVNKDDNYQANQAKIAIATGGLLGKGPGNSTQRNFLPSPYADFIYAIIIEEYGLIGAVFILMLYLFFLFRAVRIVTKAPKAFGALLATALSVSLVIQAFSNMAVAVNLFPVTGAALPLVSMGGTSMLFTSVAFGIILSVSKDIEEQEENGEKVNIA